MSFEPEEIIADLQAAIKERLAADTWFTGFDIYTPDDGGPQDKKDAPADIEERITESLGAVSKGVCIVVMLPTIEGIATDAPGIYADNVPIVIRTVEYAPINRDPTGRAVGWKAKTSSMFAIRIARRLRGLTYRSCALPVKKIGRVPDPVNQIWDVVLKTSLDIPALEEVVSP